MPMIWYWTLSAAAGRIVVFLRLRCILTYAQRRVRDSRQPYASLCSLAHSFARNGPPCRQRPCMMVIYIPADDGTSWELCRNPDDHRTPAYHRTSADGCTPACIHVHRIAYILAYRKT